MQIKLIIIYSLFLILISNFLYENNVFPKWVTFNAGITQPTHLYAKLNKNKLNLDSILLIKANKADIYKKSLNKTVFVKFNSFSKKILTKDTLQLRGLIISNAEKLLGIKYKYGGNDTLGLDCSSFIELAYLNTGIPGSGIYNRTKH